MPEAICTVCGTRFTYERVRGGRKNCDGCSRRKAAQRYKARHPDRVASSRRKWQAANPEKARAATKQWEERNPNIVREARRRRRADPVQRAKIDEWHRQWTARNRAKISARVVEWQRANPEKVYARTLRRRARLRGAAINDFTDADWRLVLNEYGHRCYYCGATDRPLQREHLIPLARGGDHTRANIVPACQPCNCRKGGKTAEEFAQCES